MKNLNYDKYTWKTLNNKRQICFLYTFFYDYFYIARHVFIIYLLKIMYLLYKQLIEVIYIISRRIKLFKYVE